MAKRKILAVLLMLALVVSLAACGSKEPEMEPGMQRKMVFGAVLATRNGMGFDSPDKMNDLEKLRHKEMLRTYWAVEDYESAMATLERLLFDGASVSSNDFLGSDELMGIFNGRIEVTAEVGKMLAPDRKDYEAALDFLEEYGYERDELTAMKTTVAWDLDRLVTVARWCIAVEYISEDEAMPYIDGAVRAAVNNYGSWEDYFAGVVIGRSLTYDGDAEGNRDVADALLKDKKSIYKKVSFKEGPSAI